MHPKELGGEMKRIQCPCCGYFTIESHDEVIVDVCEVCGWQYDLVTQKYPDRIIGPNHISLMQKNIIDCLRCGVKE